MFYSTCSVPEINEISDLIAHMVSMIIPLIQY